MMMKIPSARRIAAACLLLGSTGIAPLQAAVQAQLSRTTTHTGEPVTLILASDGTALGAGPDLAPLQRDFQVLGTSTSTQLSIVNGRGSARTQWEVQLLPRRSGALIIPALQLGAERSEPLQLQVAEGAPVTAPDTAEHVFVETAVDTAQRAPYVQEQLIYRVRLYYDGALQGGELQEPQIPDAIVERAGPELRSTAERDGREFQVLERRYAVYPQRSGTLEIPTLRFEGQVYRTASSAARSGLPGTPFANAPGLLGGMLESVRAYGPALQVEVRPPAGGRQGAWLPARAVRLQDSWTDAPPQWRAGEPVSRTITVEAEGLSGSQIPPLPIPELPQVRLYRDPPEPHNRLDGTRATGISRQTLTYIPNVAGALSVPELTLAWWDTGRDAAASARLPAWQFNVQPATGGEAAPAAPAQAPPPAVPLATDVRGVPAFWPWLAVGLAAVLVFVALLRRRLPRQPRQPGSAAPVATPVAAGRAPARPRPDRGAVLRTLQAACRDRDASAAARSLVELAAIEWPDQPPLSLGVLAGRLSTGGDAVRALDRHLYGAGHGDWPADALWAAVRDGLHAAPAAPDPDPPVPPLYARQA